MHPVKQTDVVDCGVACVKSILHYNGIFEDLYRIKMHHPLKFGFYSFQDMSEIFEKYNLTACGYFSDYESLRNLKNPVIAQLVIHGIFKHFVVIEKVSDSNIYYMDPATGENLTMTKGMFESIWTSKILLIIYSPGKGAYVAQKRKSCKMLSFVFNKRTSILILLSLLMLTAVFKFLLH